MVRKQRRRGFKVLFKGISPVTYDFPLGPIPLGPILATCWWLPTLHIWPRHFPWTVRTLCPAGDSTVPFYCLMHTPVEQVNTGSWLSSSQLASHPSLAHDDTSAIKSQHIHACRKVLKGFLTSFRCSVTWPLLLGCRLLHCPWYTLFQPCLD